GYDRGINIDNRGGSTSWSAFTGNGVFGSGISPSTNGWTFLAAVYNQTTDSLVFYVDKNSFSTSTNYDSDTAGYFDIGYNPYFGEYFTGYIDNVFVYNNALNPDQIATIRNNGFPAAVPEPASLTLLGIGAISAIGYALRRRKQAMA